MNLVSIFNRTDQSYSHRRVLEWRGFVVVNQSTSLSSVRAGILKGEVKVHD